MFYHDTGCYTIASLGVFECEITTPRSQSYYKCIIKHKLSYIAPRAVVLRWYDTGYLLVHVSYLYKRGIHSLPKAWHIQIWRAEGKDTNGSLFLQWFGHHHHGRKSGKRKTRMTRRLYREQTITFRSPCLAIGPLSRSTQQDVELYPPPTPPWTPTAW